MLRSFGLILVRPKQRNYVKLPIGEGDIYSYTYLHNTYIYILVRLVIIMKVNKTITLEAEMAEKLTKQSNGSNLINQLLEKHFDSEMLENEEEIVERIGKQEGIIKELTGSVASLKIKLAKVKKTTGKVGGLVMRNG